MAGPLSSEEIEDVVSSVRRLVSNEQRIKTRDLNAEKLVLTSAYRVVPETSPLSPVSRPLSPLMLDAPLVEAPPEPAPEVAHVVEEVAAPDAADPVATLEDSLAQALEVEVEAEPSLVTDSHPAKPESSPSDMVEAEWEDEIWVEPVQVPLGEAALAAEEAEVLMPPEAEPDVIQAAADAGEALPSEDADNALGDEPVPFVPLRRRAEDLAARVAAGAVVELPVAGGAAESADPDPDMPETVPESTEPAPDRQDPLAGSPEPVEEKAVQEAPAADKAAEPHADAAAGPAADLSPMATDLYDTDGTPLAVLDEAALNEIVRQVLRAELQGELGERITRNVRKLVRAEINRALMARDLD